MLRPFALERELSFLRSIWRWSRYWSSRHELWALQWSLKLPILGIFFIFTPFLVWVFVPVVILTLLALPVFAVLPNMPDLDIDTASGLASFVAVVILGGFAVSFLIAFTAPFAARYFHSYFIAVGLFFGKKNMAERRLAVLHEALGKMEAERSP